MSQEEKAVLKPLSRATSRFGRSEGGAATVIFGLMAIALVAMVGLAVDLGRWINARDHTLHAIDAAVLAAGRAIQTGSNENKALDVARVYYNNAIETRIKTHSDNINFEVIDQGLAVTATGNAKIKTPFMGMLGFGELPLLREVSAETDAEKNVDRPVARIANGDQGKNHVETILMLDTSGSMFGTKLQDMKDAAKDLINIVVWENQSKFESRVGLVPFSSEVRPPADMLDEIAGPAAKFSRTDGTSVWYFAPTNCVGERGGNRAYTAHAPGQSNRPFVRAHRMVASSETNSANCFIHNNNSIMPMTSNVDALNNHIDGLVASGGTAGHVGTAWTYYLLSPNWRNYLPSGTQPRGWAAGTNRKVAVLMTDGEFNLTYDDDQAPSSWPGGSGYDGSGSVNKKSSAEQAKLLCDNMKSSGIEVFTVGFGLGNNQAATSTLTHCASSEEHYYDAESGEDLKNAFRDIALQISKLYLSN